jgi:hypothetical protein
MYLCIYVFIISEIYFIKIKMEYKLYFLFGDWGWGLGIGDWGLGIGPNK